MPEADIVHDRDRERFAMRVGEHEAVLDYQSEKDVMVITHVVVPEAIAGRGIAGDLVRTAFEGARGEGRKVRPACSYAAGWAERHPEYSQLLG